MNYLQYSEELDRKYTELIELRRDIKKTISKIKDPLLSTLLERYYIDGYSWEKVAEFIGYSKFWTIKRLHPDALKAVEAVMKKAES